MGMYVCIPHKEKYDLTEGVAGAGHAICEICGYVDGDWEVKIPVIFTTDISRPIRVESPKQYILDQLQFLPVGRAIEADVFRLRLALQHVLTKAQECANSAHGQPVELEQYFKDRKYLKINLTAEDIELLRKAMARQWREEIRNESQRPGV